MIVGISWRGGTGAARRARSIPLSELSEILSQPRVGWVSLQYGEHAQELEAVRDALGVEIFHDRAIDPLQDLDAFAAQTAAMDLVISVDNSTVHMAGALNIPVWVMLPKVPDWRWRLGQAYSPWYPSARLFRQSVAGEWKPVACEVAEALATAIRTVAD
jgi:ADP-heptose:LPS heptosyltransferase